MWTRAAPSTERVAAFLADQRRNGELSYREVGASRAGAPAGFDVDHNLVRLGEGERAWAAAIEALRAWTMFPTPWTRIEPAGAPQREGEVVAMIAHVYGVWWLNACRIVYVVDEVDAGGRRVGFAYGTLREHVESGEERFMVERRADDSVWYDLRAVSRPRYWAARLAKPLARGLQRRFVRESQVAMSAAVERASRGPRSA